MQHPQLSLRRVQSLSCSRSLVDTSNTMTVGHRVVVTGATGFIAHELIKELLARGYDVHGTVRSLKNVQKLAVLRSLGESLPGPG